ncbi:MAG TPA: hypothetical protein VNC59_00520 [Thermoanaerobaculia bacterium]|nr:hypothetical protein [Thermoanaerobaculia bacterium]
MTRRPLIATALAAGFGLVLLAQEPPRAVTAAARQELVVTNQNLAVVVEDRTVTLPAGATTLLWEGAPASARTETWSVLNAREAGVRWLGLVSPFPGQGGVESEWLASLVGKQVRVRRPNGEIAEAEVVAVYGPTPAHVLFREGNELVYGEPDARISLASDRGAPERATGVRLKLESERAGSRTLTSRYLVGDLSWEAAYALSLSPDEKSGRLEGFFLVDNRSGAEYVPTRLRLLAGTLRAAAPPSAPRAMAGRMQAEMAMDSAANSIELSESRVYEVSNPPRLPGGRTTFPLAAGVDVAVGKRYVARTQYWMGQMEESQRIPVAVQYRVETKPIERALPAGVVRVYVEGGRVFTGEDRIEHTAEKTDIEIETSETFDLSARRRQVSFQQTSRLESESAYEVVITSRKKEAVTVLVRESFPGDWTIVESSVPARKLSAFVAEFAVPVPAGGEAKLTYKVRVRMRG